jgi:hypothetical protein
MGPVADHELAAGSYSSELLVTAAPLEYPPSISAFPFVNVTPANAALGIVIGGTFEKMSAHAPFIIGK